MPNWTIIRLKEKARQDVAESVFCKIEANIYRDRRPAETVDEFLKRGGKITKLPERR